MNRRDHFPHPDAGFLVVHQLTVRDCARSRDFYRDVLGGVVVMDSPSFSLVQLANGWVALGRAAAAVSDQPGLDVQPPADPSRLDSFMNLRVADIAACYEEWRAKGAEFLTPPIDRGGEIRCYMRDPDGYLIEVGQSTGLLAGLE
ncbi:MAG: VOC family protein [Dehalococcoidia bacterium]|nr:VOC family protein [Dehalococcoidia bacterium]